ncbi:gamma-glutamylcyclotransferase [Rubellimicrobium rubrum]|uniref:glutathione-specific gamma-glutamylcyclotransferase n=1 Tax=Rubellimicrobium rubrum TaxID=2585369 RepID=A0A5C4MZV8_9RHOB|nr:gamma-glutamylcyclotransferase [Rubellimicrobium rubrum]TNC50151.1 gamma-glutamylcyclotransferase [Rubellimicrobium rubrum]
MTDRTDLWLFAYGSLLWDPGFEPARSVRARLDGWRRSFCMWSFHYRGTEERPGLVLALDEDAGAFCEGVALKVEPERRDEVLDKVRSRELVSDAYEERWLSVTLTDGQAVTAVTYVVRRDHRQYASVDLDTQARTIVEARGLRGRNMEYLSNTAAQLLRLGIQDAQIEALIERTRSLAS